MTHHVTPAPKPHAIAAARALYTLASQPHPTATDRGAAATALRALAAILPPGSSDARRAAQQLSALAFAIALPSDAREWARGWSAFAAGPHP